MSPRQTRSRPLLALAWLAGLNCRAPLIAAGPLLPLIMRNLRLGATLGGSLTGLPLLVMALLSIPGGLLADRLGPRPLLVVAMLGIALAGAARALAGGTGAVLAASVALGAAIGLAQPALAQLAQSAFPDRATAATAVYANGLIVGGLAASALSAPLLLPLSGRLAWRGVFLLWSLPAVAAAIGWSLARLPAAGSPGSRRQPGRLGRILAIPGLMPVSVAFAGQTAVFYGLVTWLPDFYVAHGWSLAAASGPIVALSSTSIAGSVLSPLLASRSRGVRRPILVCSVLSLLATAAFLPLPGLGLLWGSLIGGATSVVFTLGLAAPAEIAPADQVGTAAGLVLTLGYVAAVLGPVAVGVLRDATGGFQAGIAFLALMALAMCGGAVAVPGRASATAGA